MIRLAAALLAPLALAACGRAGPPHPPGPKEQIIFPRAYPRYDPPPPVTPPPMPTPGVPAPAAKP